MSSCEEDYPLLPSSPYAPKPTAPINPDPNKRPRSSLPDHRKDREEWSDTAIGCLLDAYTEKYLQLNRGNLRGRDWEEVAANVSGRGDKLGKTVEQCKNKVDNLKKRFKVECQRVGGGSAGARSHWIWYGKMEEVVGPKAGGGDGGDEEKGVRDYTPAPRLMRRFGLFCVCDDCNCRIMTIIISD